MPYIELIHKYIIIYVFTIDDMNTKLKAMDQGMQYLSSIYTVFL